MATAPVPRDGRRGAVIDRTRPDWRARPAVIIAPGPSLTAADVDVVRRSRQADRIRVVSVSNAWKWTADFADAFFAADRRYFKAYLRNMLSGETGHVGPVLRERIVTCCNVSAKADRLQYVRAANRPGLGTYELTTGGNSGWMGLNLAYLYGARRIYLLGFDMQRGPGGLSHADGDHVKTCNVGLNFSEWIARIERYAAPELKKRGATVINCSRSTALRCWPRSTIEAELTLPQENDHAGEIQGPDEDDAGGGA